MGTSLQIIDRLVPGANLESYIQAASRIPVPVSYTHLTLPTICSV